jgi:hypothetical protein
MEEIEISSWMTLDALKKKAEIIETVGNLQTGHSMSVFCQIEDDFLELVYSDSASNGLRRFEDKDELEIGIQQRKEEDGDAPYDEDRDVDDTYEEDEDEDEEEEGGLEVEEEEGEGEEANEEGY